MWPHLEGVVNTKGAWPTRGPWSARVARSTWGGQVYPGAVAMRSVSLRGPRAGSGSVAEARRGRPGFHLVARPSWSPLGRVGALVASLPA